MKKLIYPVTLVLLSSVAFAQTTGLMHYADKGMSGGPIVAFVFFAIMSFIFSVIFWLTHNWLAKSKK